MTETSKATCATCPWWGPIASDDSGRCHHSASAADTYKADDWYCSEHPDLRLPDVHELAARAMTAMLGSERWAEMIEAEPRGTCAELLAEAAYLQADALLAEAKRRRGE